MVEPEWTSALAGYAERLHARAGSKHHVVSPLGAWLLLALCAPVSSEPETSGQLAELLGGDPEAAAGFAAALLEDPHPLVRLGAGAWVRSARETPRIEWWRRELPAAVQTGDVPAQERLDDWAVEHTMGLIKHFPFAINSDVVCLLATVLATKVSWEVPFDVVDASALGPGRWAGRLRRVLRTPRNDPRHRQYLADTERAGRVAVHLARARGGLLVGSVIAATDQVAAGDVLAAAAQIVTAEARERGSVGRCSLFDLPVGDQPAWSISEERVKHEPLDVRDEERVVSILPAWSANTNLNLSADEALGFPAAARALAKALDLARFQYEAAQAATARYSSVGFEAAAVTALAIAVSLHLSRRQRRRIATVRFAHPFAVVAVAVPDSGDRPTADSQTSAWHGVPVFSAWITEPSDAGSTHH
jgi:hypothetical protein